MVGRLVRVVGTILVIAAVGLVVPVLATSTPASAAMVVDGCTIVSNPTPTDFTNCPGATLAGAGLSGVNLSYANLANATFETCTEGFEFTCTDTDLSGANLTQANLSGAIFIACFVPPDEVGACGAEDLTDANLTGANLSNAYAETANFDDATLVGANLTNTNLGGADLDSANLTGAALTGATFVTVLPIGGAPEVTAALFDANFSGTILVPPNQSVMATSQAGAVATWSTPSGLPGATPGSCTPASGSTFPLFTSTVTCQVLDARGEVATGTFEVTVPPTTQRFTRVLVPSNGATLSGSTYLDASASNATSVEFRLFGGSFGYSGPVICTATPTIYGWLCSWNTSTVPNGSYVLVSEAFNSSGSAFSSGVNITVKNPLPTTSVLIPWNGAKLSGFALLDATARIATSVEFRLFGGNYGYSGPVICKAVPTILGWLCAWNTTTVPNGSYVLLSEAFNSTGSAFSSGVSITVDN